MDEELDASNYDWTTGPEEGDPLNYTDYTNNEDSGYFDSDNPYVNNSSSGYYGSNTLSSSEEADLNAAAAKNPSLSSFVSKVFTTLGDAGKSFIKDYLYKDGKLNLAGIATAAVMLKAFSGGDKPKSTAYQGKIPNLVAVNKQIAYDDPNRVPGSAGREYFTNTQFVDPSKVAEAQTAADTQAKGILAAYKKAAAEPNPYAGKFAMSYEKPPAETGNVSSSPASGVKALLPVPQADDTIDEMAGGGMAKGRYLQGTTDGMADKIPSSIDGKQKAALSHGEFVIPADVVSHLGNGNSDAGAKKLYEMMSRVRKARTGNPEQGKRIDPNKFVPGGQVGYASGGIARFNTGGTTPSTGTTGTGTGTTNPTVPSEGESVATGLSSWAGDYVTDYLGKGKAIANQPYQAYTGKLTAGPSDLQQQQFAGLSDVAKTGYTPYTAKGGIFDTSAAQQYMNPYLSAALDPQLKELRRQGQITNLGNQAQATKMGAFGSSGSALMQTEGQRNVMDKMQQALGEGYNTAYDKAMAQYNADQNRQLEAGRDTEASRQYSANFGLKTLGDLGVAGQTQRDIEQQGLTADKTQFEEARDYPSKAVQFQKSLLSGLPITTTDTTPMQSDIAKISNQITGLLTLYNQLATLGQTK